MNAKLNTTMVLSPATAPANTMHTDPIDMSILSEVIFTGVIIGDGAKYTLEAEALDDSATPKVLGPVEFSYAADNGQQKIVPSDKNIEVGAGEVVNVYINSQCLGKLEAASVRLKLGKKTAGTNLCFFACTLGARY